MWRKKKKKKAKDSSASEPEGASLLHQPQNGDETETTPVVVRRLSAAEESRNIEEKEKGLWEDNQEGILVEGSKEIEKIERIQEEENRNGFEEEEEDGSLLLREIPVHEEEQEKTEEKQEEEREINAIEKEELILQERTKEEGELKDDTVDEGFTRASSFPNSSAGKSRLAETPLPKDKVIPLMIMLFMEAFNGNSIFPYVAYMIYDFHLTEDTRLLGYAYSSLQQYLPIICESGNMQEPSHLLSS